MYINSVSTTAKLIFGEGTERAIFEAVSPQGIKQHIVDFFTCGRERKRRIEHYDLFARALTSAFYKTSIAENTFAIPEKLIVEFEGYTVTFTQPGKHNETNLVTIEVRKGLQLVKAEVDKSIFNRICTVLVIRQRLNLPHSAITLTDSGKMNLSNIDLRGMDLGGVDLTGADLREAQLCGADLREVSLDGADLSGADLTGVNLAGVNLKGLSMEKVKLRGANLSGADLRGTNLCGIALNSANLRGAKLQGADLDHADLRNTDLTEAFLGEITLNGTRFEGANLDNLPHNGHLLKLPLWNANSMDIHLNNINNQSGTLLSMMDSIDESFVDVKLRMARELIASLQNVDLSSVALPLLNVLSRAPYCHDPDVDIWLDTVNEFFFKQYDEQIMPPLTKGELGRSAALFGLFRFFSRQTKRMFSHNGAFIQLVARGREAKDEVIIGSVTRLYDIYLNHERVKPYVALEVFGVYGTHKIDWKDKHAVNYIHFSSQPDGPVMLLSHHSLLGMLQPDPENSVWSHHYLCKDAQDNLHPADYPLKTLFADYFKLFLGPYNYALQSVIFDKLLGTLKMGDDMQKLFISATHLKESKIKLVSPEQQERLGEIFRPKLAHSTVSGDYSLTSEHYNEIIAAYALADAGDCDRAETLLSLAAVFTKYSSSAIFGTENESPEMLRRYAYALMEKAYTLNGGIFPIEDKNNFAAWKNCLLGLEGAFSCSAVLSNIMVMHIRGRFPKVLAGIIPPAWS